MRSISRRTRRGGRRSSCAFGHHRAPVDWPLRRGSVANVVNQPSRWSRVSNAEHVVLLRYCRDHNVARCGRCETSYHQQELGSALLGYLPLVCPTCRDDLIGSVRAHIHDCPALPNEVGLRAKEVVEATQRLIKQSQALADFASVLVNESQAHRATQRALLKAARVAQTNLRRALHRARPRGR